MGCQQFFNFFLNVFYGFEGEWPRKAAPRGHSRFVVEHQVVTLKSGGFCRFRSNGSLRSPSHEPSNAAVPAAGSSGVSPLGSTQGGTPCKLAGEDACATPTAQVQGFKARNSVWENSHPAPLLLWGRRGRKKAQYQVTPGAMARELVFKKRKLGRPIRAANETQRLPNPRNFRSLSLFKFGNKWVLTTA